MRQLLGPGLIALAALLWATDAPFRAPLTHRIDATAIVLFDHLVGGALILIATFLKHRARLFQLSFKDGLLAFLVGAGGSALATVLFTAAFQHLNPSVVILLQKLQPIFVVLVAYAFLKERPKRSFYGWAALALIAALLLTIPYLQFKSLLHGMLALDLQSKGVLYALGAAALWGASTVCGKVLLQRHSPAVVTFWRYAFGTLALLAIFALSPSSVHLGETVASLAILKSMLYICLVSGLLALLVYYQGLSRTPASVATFVELVYPVSAVLLNTWLLHAPLTPLQAVAGTVLIFSVLRLSSP